MINFLFTQNKTFNTVDDAINNLLKNNIKYKCSKCVSFNNICQWCYDSNLIKDTDNKVVNIVCNCNVKCPNTCIHIKYKVEYTYCHYQFTCDCECKCSGDIFSGNQCFICDNSCCSRCYTSLGITECRNNICFPCIFKLRNLLSTKNENETINDLCDLCFETFDCYMLEENNFFDKTFSKSYICVKCAKKIYL